MFFKISLKNGHFPKIFEFSYFFSLFRPMAVPHTLLRLIILLYCRTLLPKKLYKNLGWGVVVGCKYCSVEDRIQKQNYSTKTSRGKEVTSLLHSFFTQTTPYWWQRLPRTPVEMKSQCNESACRYNVVLTHCFYVPLLPT
jgi:hypothetical protein